MDNGQILARVEDRGGQRSGVGTGILAASAEAAGRPGRRRRPPEGSRQGQHHDLIDPDQPIPLAGVFLDALDLAGGNVARSACAIGISVEDLEAGVPSSVIDQFVSKAFVSIASPSFGLAAGQCMDAERFGLVGFLAMTSATLGDALQRIVRFSRLNWGDMHHWSETADTVTIKLQPLYPHRSYTYAKLDMGVVSLAAFAARFTRQPIAPLAASFSRPRPAHSSRYEDVLGCAVEFGRHDSITFCRADLARRLVSANPALAQALEGQAEAMLRRLVVCGLVDKVTLVVQAIMQEREPSLAAVAAALCMSLRTLQRRLAEDGLRYNDLVDRIRRDAAERHLGTGRLSVVEVAFLLGYESPSSFYRAFKRWTGETPSHFRRRAAR
jgi:AraC-like DNA-binding protein